MKLKNNQPNKVPRKAMASMDRTLTWCTQLWFDDYLDALANRPDKAGKHFWCDVLPLLRWRATHSPRLGKMLAQCERRIHQAVQVKPLRRWWRFW